MSFEDQFLPGLAENNHQKTDVSQNTEKNRIENSKEVSRGFFREERPGFVEGCPQCEIEGAFGCVRHRKLK